MAVREREVLRVICKVGLVLSGEAIFKEGVGERLRWGCS